VTHGTEVDRTIPAGVFRQQRLDPTHLGVQLVNCFLQIGNLDKLLIDNGALRRLLHRHFTIVSETLSPPHLRRESTLTRVSSSGTGSLSRIARVFCKLFNRLVEAGDMGSASRVISVIFGSNKIGVALFFREGTMCCCLRVSSNRRIYASRSLSSSSRFSTTCRQRHPKVNSPREQILAPLQAIANYAKAAGLIWMVYLRDEAH
jgi:hypothetical protein